MVRRRSQLLAHWQDLQQAQDHDDEAPGWANRDHAIGLARGAYLDAVRDGAIEDEAKPRIAEHAAAYRRRATSLSGR
jgi:hypothetical protein